MRTPWNKGLKTGLAPWRGKKRGPRSEAAKKKTSAALLGKPKSAEHRANIAKARTGARHTEESNEKNRIAHLGKKHTPEARNKMRAVVVRGKDHQWWGKTPDHGPRTHWVEYGGISLRSKYEVRFAKALDARNIKWVYEHKRFDLGEFTYLPDFYLPEMEAYWEVKGWLDPKSQLKVKLFREQNPEISLIVATLPVIEMFEKRSRL